MDDVAQDAKTPQSVPVGKSKEGQIALKFENAERIFSGQPYHGGGFTDAFKASLKILGQIYDTIQRYMTGLYRTSDNHFPTTEEVYRELQTFKRSINDKLPMPDDQQFAHFCLMLAAQEPPLIHILREFKINKNGENEMITRYVAPADKNQEKILDGYRFVLGKSYSTLTDLKEKSGLFKEWANETSETQNLNEVNVRQGQVGSYLSEFFLTAKKLGLAEELDLQNIKAVNSQIRKHILKPLQQKLVQEKEVLAFSCSDIRASGRAGSRQIGDIIVLNNPQILQDRYAGLCGLLHSPACQSLFDMHTVKSLRSRQEKGEITQEVYFEKLAGNLLERSERINEAEEQRQVIELAAEVIKLSPWQQAYQSKQQKDQEKDHLKRIVDTVKKHASIYRVKFNPNSPFQEKYVLFILKGGVPSIMAVTTPYDDFTSGENHLELVDYDGVFLLYKDRKITGNAVENACDLYSKSGDVFMLRILENMLGVGVVPEAELKRFVAPAYYDKLLRAIKDSYTGELSLFRKLWFHMFGSEITNDELRKIRSKVKMDGEEKLNRRKGIRQKKEQVSARQQVRTLAKKRMGTESDGTGVRYTREDWELFKQLKSFVDRSWEQKHYPREQDVLESVDGNKLSNARNLLEMVNSGAVSYASMLRIPTPGEESIYLTKDFLDSYRTAIVAQCRKGLQGDESNADMFGLDPEIQAKNVETFQAILDYLSNQ